MPNNAASNSPLDGIGHIPVACDLSVFTDLERARHEQTGIALFRQVEEIKDLTNGYAFRFVNEDATLFNLCTFISNEQRCCPFFQFEIQVLANHGPIWLRLTGDDANSVKALIANSPLLPPL